MLADFVDRHDVFVIEPGHIPGLAAEALHGLVRDQLSRQDHLEGDGAFEGGLPSAVDDAHPTACDLAQDFVAGDARQRRRRTRGAGRGRGDCGWPREDLGQDGGGEIGKARGILRGGRFVAAAAPVEKIQREQFSQQRLPGDSMGLIQEVLNARVLLCLPGLLEAVADRIDPLGRIQGKRLQAVFRHRLHQRTSGVFDS